MADHRRLALLAACFVPLWIIPGLFGALATKAFWVQFHVQGAWGVMPILLAEMSPRAFYATFPGVAYQLGNMVSSASVQIDAAGGNTSGRLFYMTTKDVPDYAKATAEAKFRKYERKGIGSAKGIGESLMMLFIICHGS